MNMNMNMNMNVVDMAYQIIELHERNIDLAQQNAMLTEENERYKADLEASIKSGEQQMGGWLQLLLTKQIVPRNSDATA